MMADEGAGNSAKKTFVLCFDGTGNKFEGTDTDSNIIKIYRLLDRSLPNQYHYYQPGIGTYGNSASLDHTGTVAKIKSWYLKNKDAAVGTNLALHVMGGYKFLMRYYSPEDDIYIFGFSRGAYTARFLAEMLDHIGLLSAGNEELQRFAWKCFSKWQARRGGSTPEDQKEELRMHQYLKNFRETFSRPVRRIRFLGLFDTVNSVPRFENAWMQRTKFPYTARTNAKVIRHAVSINERRAKFRSDLIANSAQMERERDRAKEGIQPFHRYEPNPPAAIEARTAKSHSRRNRSLSPRREKSYKERPEQQVEQHHLAHEQALHLGVTQGPQVTHKSGNTGPITNSSTENLYEDAGEQDVQQSNKPRAPRRYSDTHRTQDILEVWFPGNHSDIGGGWHKADGEKWALSHAPLVWMVQEAELAGLQFDKWKMASLNCCPDVIDEYGNRTIDGQVDRFSEGLHQSSTQGFIHDCLEYGGGLAGGSVLSWKIMEYLPFRRMDLKSDGGWRTIRWPLPQGETRDIPGNANIHRSAIVRMQTDPKYRPGNLILLGKGGRGVKTAPKHAGIGEWEIVMNEGNPVSEVYTQKRARQEAQMAEKNGNTA